jgi:class 3 adenylate cyclase
MTFGQPPAARVCIACGTRNPRGARFCNGCGMALALVTAVEPGSTRSADPSERRQLTVLFCDLVGSTALGGRLDLEDYYALVRSYHDRADKLIVRYGGTVNQHQGDGVLAYFGWPAAYGDDPDRAVRAGLALAEAVRGMATTDGTRLAARVGIHTGPVVVSEVDDGINVETFALGETPNIASRVQALAEPDNVVVTAATHRLVSGLFHVEDRGAQTLKGVAEPVGVYRVVRPSGVRNRLAAAATRGLTPFVGREDERGVLQARWNLALALAKQCGLPAQTRCRSGSPRRGPGRQSLQCVPLLPGSILPGGEREPRVPGWQNASPAMLKREKPVAAPD